MRLLLTLVYLLSTLLAADASDAPFASDRSLQTTCDRSLGMVKDTTVIARSMTCNCESQGADGGSKANIACTSCEYCNLYETACGTSNFTASFAYESDGTMVGERKECFNYTLGGKSGDFLCIQETFGSDVCKLTLNGNACSSCEMQNCTSDGSKRQPKADCSNLPYGEVYDLCSTSINVTDTTSSFVAFDRTFRENAYGVVKCKSSATMTGVWGGVWMTALATSLFGLMM
jgi:hypothetical protein